MTIRLSDERRSSLVLMLQQFFTDEFDEPISDFRAERLIDFLVESVAPVAYNQGVRDAIAYIQDRLADVEGDVYAGEIS